MYYLIYAINKTVIDHQNRIKYNNLNLKIPILVLFVKNQLNLQILTGDDTLEVEHIDKYSENLGTNLKI